MRDPRKALELATAFFNTLAAYQSDVKAGRNPGDEKRRALRRVYGQLKGDLDALGIKKHVGGLTHVPLYETALEDFGDGPSETILAALTQGLDEGDVALGKLQREVDDAAIGAGIVAEGDQAPGLVAKGTGGSPGAVGVGAPGRPGVVAKGGAAPGIVAIGGGGAPGLVGIGGGQPESRTSPPERASPGGEGTQPRPAKGWAALSRGGKFLRVLIGAAAALVVFLATGVVPLIQYLESKGFVTVPKASPPESAARRLNEDQQGRLTRYLQRVRPRNVMMIFEAYGEPERFCQDLESAFLDAGWQGRCQQSISNYHAELEVGAVPADMDAAEAVRGGLKQYAGFEPRLYTFENEPGTLMLKVGRRQQDDNLQKPASSPSKDPPPPAAASPTLEGDYQIRNTKDVADLQAYTEVTGGLTIAGQGLTKVALPRLKRIGGKLSIYGANELSGLALPALQQVGDDLNLDSNDTLESLDLTALETVNGHFNLQDTKVTTLSLPALVTVGGHFMLDNNHALRAATVSRLRSIGRDLDIKGNIVLSGADFPSLVSVGNNLNVFGNATLASLRGLGALSQLGGSSFRVKGNAQLLSRDVNDLLGRLKTFKGSVDLADSQTPK